MSDASDSDVEHRENEGGDSEGEETQRTRVSEFSVVDRERGLTGVDYKDINKKDDETSGSESIESALRFQGQRRASRSVRGCPPLHR